MSLFRALQRSSPRNLAIGKSSTTASLRDPAAILHHGGISAPFVYGGRQHRSAKTVTKRKVKDLTQGVIQTVPLPAQESKDVPRYPSVLQGVRNNMIKFDQCVVITRVGSFYELYFEHAKEYGPLLGLKVAERATSVGPVAMAGFPFWQLDRFLKILVQDLNRYVAISEQFQVTEPDKLKSGDLQFDRRVSRIVTPGTLIDENFLDPYQNNYLLALHVEGRDHTSIIEAENADSLTKSAIGLAWLDLSTGDFLTQETTYAQLPAMMLRINPRELLIPAGLPHTLKDELGGVMGHSKELITEYEAAFTFTSVTEWNSMLEGPVSESFNEKFSLREKLAGHRLLDYVRTRLPDLQLQLRHPRKREEDDILGIDRGSLRGLEILETAKDGLGKGSLFHAVRRTVTKGGSRLLRDRLTSPSTSLIEISERLDLITRFLGAESVREGVVGCLRKTFDVKRLVQKFAANRGDAEDMLCLARAISETSNVYEWLRTDLTNQGANHDQDPFQAILNRFHVSEPQDLSKRILDAIDEEGLQEQHRMQESEDAEVAELVQEVVSKSAPQEQQPLSPKARSKSRTSFARAHYEENEDPWIIQRSASKLLNQLHVDLETLKHERTSLQERLRREFDTPKLDLRWTPGLGHICHITFAKNLDEHLLQRLRGRVVSSSKSTRSLQFTEWSRLGEQLAQKRLDIRKEESRIFRQIRQHIINNLVYLRRNAAIIDELDVATSFAVLAQEQSWTRPTLNNSLSHKIVGGRHPTVKVGLEEQGRSFVSNDLFLGDQERIWIVTGPNMAGKSTFLRQNALITILAQVGSYVPADYVEIGLVDQIFSRIGAADDLFRNQSTFMVEMLETAAILKHATARSFVIMDEVGRGTTPEDGTAISFASLHHLYHASKPRTLFATHFHALVDLTQDWTDIGRYCTDVVEDATGSFSFVHKLRPGVNRQSHALKVARMAGIPESVLKVASVVQEQMMEKKQKFMEQDSPEGDYRSKEAAIAVKE